MGWSNVMRYGIISCCVAIVVSLMVSYFIALKPAMDRHNAKIDAYYYSWKGYTRDTIEHRFPDKDSSDYAYFCWNAREYVELTKYFTDYMSLNYRDLKTCFESNKDDREEPSKSTHGLS
jgi:hypothetical protein